MSTRDKSRSLVLRLDADRSTFTVALRAEAKTSSVAGAKWSSSSQPSAGTRRKISHSYDGQHRDRSPDWACVFPIFAPKPAVPVAQLLGQHRSPGMLHVMTTSSRLAPSATGQRCESMSAWCPALGPTSSAGASRLDHKTDAPNSVRADPHGNNGPCPGSGNDKTVGTRVCEIISQSWIQAGSTGVC